MYKQFFAAILMAGLLIFNGCHGDHPHDEDGGHAHDEQGGHTESHLEPVAYTLWTDKSELFVEFKPLIIGKESRFAAHFSDMSNFKAVTEGEVKAVLRNGDQTIAEASVSAPSSPGIFRPSITPETAGNYELDFVINTPEFSDIITISDIQVYSDVSTAIHENPPGSEGDEISFLKEQAWKIDFGISQAKKQSINEVIHASGAFQPVKGDEKIIAARSSGIVLYKSNKLQEGREVRNGETLFTISSAGLVQSNIGEKFEIAKARLEKTRADFERAEKLVDKQIISQKEFERRKMEYSIAEAEFKTLTSNYHGNGQSITSPMAGIVKNVLVTDGQFVEEGAPLIEITRNRRLILQAEVSQSQLSKLHSLKSANFKTAYDEEVQSIEDYNGRLISYGKVLEDGNSFIPVLFELDNLHGLIPGSYAELFLLTSPIENQLVIPRTALMQDYTSYYVYVQTEGESFDKREVKMGISDGINVQILSGVDEGEWVVTEGAYQIKMASMSSTIPAHGHEH